jgi:hypothetical protein
MLMLRSFSRWLPAILVCGWLGAPASAQVEATFAKITPVKPSFGVLPKSDAAHRAVFNPDASKIATVDAAGTLRVLSVDKGEKVWTFPAKDEVSPDATAVTWSFDGKFVITGHKDGTVRKLNADTGEKVWQKRVHSGPVNDVAVSRDADVIASASDDKTVRLYNAQGEQTWNSQLHADRVLSVDLTYNGKFVLSGDAAGTMLLCAAINEPEKTSPLVLRTFPKSDAAIVRVSIDPKTNMTDPLEIPGRGKMVGDPGTDPIKLRLLAADRSGVVTYYDLEKTKPVRRRKFDAAIVDLALSPQDKDNGQVAIVGTKKGAFAFHPQDADSVGYGLEFTDPLCVAVSDDGRRCLVGGAPAPASDAARPTVSVYIVN